MTHDQTTPAPVEVTQLKPCPFCGGNAKAYKHTTSLMPDSWHVECKNEACGCGTCHHETRTEAIAAWNTRHSAPAGEVEPDYYAYYNEDDELEYLRGCREPLPEGWTETPLYTHPAPPADVGELVEVCQRILDRGYISACIEEEREDYIALRNALAKHTRAQGEG